MAPSGALGVRATEDAAVAAARARADNERLWAENLRLRATVAAARPETPQEGLPAALADTSPGASAADAAEELVLILREGSELQKEKQGLAVQNSQLAAEVSRLAAEILDPAAAAPALALAAAVAAPAAGEPGLALEDVEAQDGQPSEEGDLAALERLLPLLREGDLLAAERHQLREEHGALAGGVAAVLCDQAAIDGGAADGLALGLTDAGAGGEDLEARLRVVVEDARRENLALQVDVHGLRQANATLRRDREAAASRAAEAAVAKDGASPDGSPGGSPSRRRRKFLGMDMPEDAVPLPISELDIPAETPEEAKERRDKELSGVLRKQMKAGEGHSPRPTSQWTVAQPLPGKRLPEEVQQLAVRDALQSLCRGLAAR